MKTSDLHISESGSNGAGGTLRAFFSLDWFGAKAKKKGKSKLKAGPHPSAAGLPDSKTRTSQSVADVLKLLRADGARRVGVFGDRGFADLMAAQAADLGQVWISTDFISDVPAGAKRLNGATLDGLDAVVVGGAGDIATRFRFAVREVGAHAPDLPVHWIAENWEFCGGTAAIPVEIDDLDALVFNHFEEFFGIKDDLQFRFEVIAESGIKRGYRILGPNQSMALNLNALAGVGADGRREGPVCLKIWVAHPFLTRGRHYRFRICGDVFWKDSFTIIHGSHQFFKNPNRLQEFRLIDSVVRERGHVLMTVPNYDLDMGSDDSISIGAGGGKAQQRRSRKRPVEVVDFERRPAERDSRQYFAAAYHGYGTSFWYALEEGLQGKQGSIAANHLCRVGVDDRSDIVFKPEERDIVEKAIAAGFMINPVAVPVRWGRDDLSFGFNFDASNPPFADYLVRFYDGGGKVLGEYAYHKDFIGAVLIEDVVRQWNGAEAAKVATTLVAPDHLKIGLAPQRLVTTADMLVRHLKTGDQDYTEFQNSWRNLGAVVPTLPHWLHPSIGVIGRTNIMGRVRTKGGYRTGVYVVNASGNLAYDMPAEVEISAINNAGRRLPHYLTLPAFGSQVVWLDDVLPDLAQHLGTGGIGTLQVKSADADLNAHVIGVSPGGAVGVQHLWGY